MPIEAASWLVQHASSYSIAPRPVPDGQQASSTARLVVILNAHSGAKNATQLWQDVAKPLLDYALPPNVVWDGSIEETREIGDGERIGRSLRPSADGTASHERLVLLIAGGDGTVHEVLNGLLFGNDGDLDARRSKWEIQIVLVPAGTANALYYHSFPPESPSFPANTPASPFYSLLSFLARDELSSKEQLSPIALALNTLPSTSKPSRSKQIVTTVVSSAALHACLLHDAEELRASHPGLERFKIAAQQNVQQWWGGTLRLRGQVRKYSPVRQTWLDAPTSTIDVRGPFAYLVTALVSRFEQSFVVAPFRSSSHPLSPEVGDAPSFDVICIRPLRHEPTRRKIEAGQEQEAREAFVQRVWEVTGGMYDGGKHVEAVYPAGELAQPSTGEADRELATDGVVEVYRCQEAEWLPDASEQDLKSRLVCLDGAIHDLGVPAIESSAAAERHDMSGLSIKAIGGASAAGGGRVSLWV